MPLLFAVAALCVLVAGLLPLVSALKLRTGGQS